MRSKILESYPILCDVAKPLFLQGNRLQNNREFPFSGAFKIDGNKPEKACQYPTHDEPTSTHTNKKALLAYSMQSVLGLAQVITVTSQDRRLARSMRNMQLTWFALGFAAATVISCLLFGGCL